MKGSPGGSSVGKSSVGSGGGPGESQVETITSVEVEKPEVELTNLVKCSLLTQSQSSLKSSSSVGSVRGDEGGLHLDFYGDYCPLFDNGQESDSASVRGEDLSNCPTPSASCLFVFFLWVLTTALHCQSV